mmetsp:Transcript_27110/g.84699  ORF Transcript_27110/g.84699 Transcript_27110/m.84699 type:complete len:216 (-) Transcript_27110:636-1283(-)
MRWRCIDRDWICSSHGRGGLCFNQSTRRWVYSGSGILPSRHQMENSPCRRRSNAMRNLKRIRERWTLETNLGKTTTVSAALASAIAGASEASPSLAAAEEEAAAGRRWMLKSKSSGGSARNNSQEPKRRRTAGPAGTSRVGAPWRPFGRGTPPRPRGTTSVFAPGSATSSFSKRPRPIWSKRFPAWRNSGSVDSCSWSCRANPTSSRSQNLDFSR